MKSIKNVLSAIFLIAMTFSLFVFFLQNGDRVKINFLHLSTPELQIWIYVLGAFALGLVTMGIILSFSILRLKSQLKKQKKNITSIEQELHQLRNFPIDELPKDPQVEVAKVVDSKNRFEKDYG